MKKYAVKILNPWKRLDKRQLWQKVDAEHNRLIIAELDGLHRVIDLGCGYGSLTATLTKRGVWAVGIDSCKEIIESARTIFSDIDPSKLRVMNAEDLDFSDNALDAVVLRDSLHHLRQSANFTKAMDEIERTIKSGGKLIVFDPQPNLVVRIARWMVGHKDPELKAREAESLLKSRGWVIEKRYYTEFFAMAASGGYVGPVLIPPGCDKLHKAIIEINRLASVAIDKIGLGKVILWRYLIVAEFHKAPGH
ncbi:MAG: class I SAM-dependent methyltransferase [Planctomycetota bacterium]